MTGLDCERTCGNPIGGRATTLPPSPRVARSEPTLALADDRPQRISNGTVKCRFQDFCEPAAPRQLAEGQRALAAAFVCTADTPESGWTDPLH